MFKVLFPPFDTSLCDNPEVCFLIAYESNRRTKFIVACISKDKASHDRILWRHETTSESLNASDSYQFISEMLRSIEYTWRQGDEHRRRDNLRPVMSISYRDGPGQGGSGVEGYW